MWLGQTTRILESEKYVDVKKKEGRHRKRTLFKAQRNVTRKRVRKDKTWHDKLDWTKCSTIR